VAAAVVEIVEIIVLQNLVAVEEITTIIIEGNNKKSLAIDSLDVPS
jgi:hypothetical protein